MKRQIRSILWKIQAFELRVKKAWLVFKIVYKNSFDNKMAVMEIARLYRFKYHSPTAMNMLMFVDWLDESEQVKTTFHKNVMTIEIHFKK